MLVQLRLFIVNKIGLSVCLSVCLYHNLISFSIFNSFQVFWAGYCFYLFLLHSDFCIIYVLLQFIRPLFICFGGIMNKSCVVDSLQEAVSMADDDVIFQKKAIIWEFPRWCHSSQIDLDKNIKYQINVYPRKARCWANAGLVWQRHRRCANIDPTPRMCFELKHGIIRHNKDVLSFIWFTGFILVYFIKSVHFIHLRIARWL